jgi:hypothetical protein
MAIAHLLKEGDVREEASNSNVEGEGGGRRRPRRQAMSGRQEEASKMAGDDPQW